MIHTAAASEALLRESDALGVCIFTNWHGAGDILKYLPTDVHARLEMVRDTGEFMGTLGESAIVHRFEKWGPRRIVLVGVGDRNEFNRETLRSAISQISRRLQTINCRLFSLYLGGLPEWYEQGELAEAAAEGFQHSQYRCDRHCTKERTARVEPELLLISNAASARDDVHAGAHRGEIIGRAINLTRELAEEPSNILTPQYFAGLARQYDDGDVLTTRIIDEASMADFGMNLVLAVSRGSREPATMTVMEYHGDPESSRSVVLVGKGVTFDSGGISLKRRSSIYEMKRDMTGGAIILSTMLALRELRPAINVSGVIIAAENMPGQHAYKPGDIIQAMNGQWVEIFSTDAEGRLLLADAMTWCQRFLKPECMVDVATLTGAASKALGPRIIPYFATSKWLSRLVRRAAKRSGENLWELPLFEEYTERVRSHFADMKNNSPRDPATIAAALFLKEFVEPSLPWLHLDIAGVDTNGKPYSYIPSGATGIGTKTLIELVCEYDHLHNSRQFHHSEAAHHSIAL